MKLNILLCGFIFLIFELSCKETYIKTDLSNPDTNELKALTLSSKRYVAPTGNDNNPGTSTSPFRTIQRAADIVNPGDTVIIRDGIYTGAGISLVNVTRSGVPGNYIVFIAENKWGAILDGKSTLNTAFQLLYGASYIKFINLAITGFLDSGYNANHADYVEQYITIQGNKIYDIGRIETNSSFGIKAIYIRRGNHDWSIDKNLIYNIGRTGPDTYYMNKDHAVYVGEALIRTEAAHHINITNNVMFGISGAAITNGSNYDLIANNVFAWRNENSMGASCFIAVDEGVTNLTIINNIFYQPPLINPFSVNGYAPYIGWVIKNNMVYGGSMWYSANAAQLAVMAGGNFGQDDCEKAEVDPKFISAVRANAPNVDFRLQSGSPAINAGANLGLTSDFLGNPIIGLPDIGAYEAAAFIPIIGLNTIGGISEKGDNGFWIANSFTAGSSITVNRMNLFVAAASGNARLGIYSNNSGEPGTLLAQTNDIILSNGWNGAMLGSSLNLAAGSTYWLAFEVSSPTTTLYFNSALSMQRYITYVYGPLPAAAPLKCASGSGAYSIFADYSGIAPTSVTGVSTSPASAGIVVGGTQQLTATVSPANATNKTVTWSSGNSSIATVNSTGLVTGVAAGNAIITATTQDGSKTAVCAVTVSGISLTLNTLGLSTIGGLPEKGVNGFWIANSFTAVSNMTVTKMNLFVATASGNARLGIYSSNGSEPGTRLAQTGEVLLTNGWNSGSLGSSLNLISGVTYWLAIEINSPATTLQYNTATGRQRYIPYIYGSLPASAPLKCLSGTGIYSVFAN